MSDADAKEKKDPLHELFPEAHVDKKDGVIGWNFEGFFPRVGDDGYAAKIKPPPEMSFIELPDPIIKMIDDNIFGIFHKDLYGYADELEARGGTTCVERAKQLRDGLELLHRHGKDADKKGIKKIDFFEQNHYTNLKRMLADSDNAYSGCHSSTYKEKVGAAKDALEKIYIHYQDNKRSAGRSI